MFETIQHSIITLSMIYSVIMVVGVSLYSLFLIRSLVNPLKWDLAAAVLYLVYVGGVMEIGSLPTGNLWFWPITALVIMPLITSRLALIPIVIPLAHKYGRKA